VILEVITLVGLTALLVICLLLLADAITHHGE
jgi:hypothetical protein